MNIVGTTRVARSIARTAAWTTVLVFLMLGCEESVDPYIGSDYPFTVWGFMNAGSDTQYVRVFEISEELLPNPDATIDADVFSTNLTTGERRAWSYEKVVFDSTFAGHVFWSPFRAEHEHRYLLEVVRSDGATSSATVTVPSEVAFEIEALGNSVTATVLIEGDVPNIVGPKVTYEAINIPPPVAWPPGSPVHPPVAHPVVVSYDHELQRVSDGWRLQINMLRDTTNVRAEYQQNCLTTSRRYSAPHIWLQGVEFSFVAADSAWAPPGGDFDPENLAVPGTMSNIQNGYGFFGAGQGVRYNWTPSVEVRERLGYSADARCSFGTGTPRDVDECRNPPIPCVGENAQNLWQVWLR